MAAALLAREQPEITFLCSPNNPTGRAEPKDTVEAVLAAAPGLVIVDEAYGQFSSWSALSLRRRRRRPRRRPTPDWSSPAPSPRPGPWPAPAWATWWPTPRWSPACEAVVLPYHLSAQTQLAGLLALRYADEMEARVALIAEERGRVAAALGDLPVESWPSEANFILFRPLGHDADKVWQRPARPLGAHPQLRQLGRPRGLPAGHHRSARRERPVSDRIEGVPVTKESS